MRTSWDRIVRRKVVLGEISGRTAKDVSPTRPLVTLPSAASLIDNPSFGATTMDQLSRMYGLTVIYHRLIFGL